MSDPRYVQHLSAAATFSATQMVKVDCFRSDRLLVGLNCFASGQSQRVHAHAGADKFYLVVTGKARFVVGDTTAVASAGDLILAPAGVPHGVAEALEPTVVLVAMAPAPS
ncbi:MAG TPA: cupin domain-containing protein [Gemmatimonadales bacterium]|nr:cupin domain-containing protein [Gemmatimonadales bacterium]